METTPKWARHCFCIKKSRPIKNQHFSFKILKTKHFPVGNLGFFSGRTMHFGIYAIAHCACAGWVFCARIARTTSYIHLCMESKIIFHADVTAKKSHNFFLMHKKYIILMQKITQNAGLAYSRVVAGVCIQENKAIKLFQCINEMCNNI